MGRRRALVYLTNGAPTPATCAELGRGELRARWLELRECEPVTDATVTEIRFGIMPTAVFVPLRTPGSTGAYPVVAEIRDREAIDAFVASQRDPAALARLRWTGVVRLATEVDDDVREHLHAIGTLLPAHVVVQQGESPSLFWPLLRLAAGLVLLALAAAAIVSTRETMARARSR